MQKNATSSTKRSGNAATKTKTAPKAKRKTHRNAAYVINIKIDAVEKTALQRVAERWQVSKSAVIRQLILIANTRITNNSPFCANGTPCQMYRADLTSKPADDSRG